MTLFAALAGAESPFAAVLEKYYSGQRCVRTQHFLAAGTRRE